MSLETANKLRELLHTIFPEAKDVASGSEVTINCPLCRQQGDPDTGHHMYISLGLNNKPPMFNCFRRTGHSGLLTKHSLDLLSNHSQYVDTRLFEEIEKENNRLYNYRGYDQIRTDKLAIYAYNEESKKNKHKLDYISNRIGVPITVQDCIQNKIVLSLKQFLYNNHIQEITRDRRMIDLLDEHFIGFLTNTNTSLIMRNTIKDTSLMKNKYYAMRYIKYNIIQNPMTSYYSIPSECDIYKPIEIHIAEGPFDILSIFYNLQHCDRKNKAYAAIGSKAYLNLIKYYFISLGLINVRFHIYIDNGIEESILKNIAYKLKPLHIDTYIHINVYKNEKDFGVPLNRISDYCYKL